MVQNESITSLFLHVQLLDCDMFCSNFFLSEWKKERFKHWNRKIEMLMSIKQFLLLMKLLKQQNWCLYDWKAFFALIISTSYIQICSDGELIVQATWAFQCIWLSWWIFNLSQEIIERIIITEELAQDWYFQLSVSESISSSIKWNPSLYKFIALNCYFINSVFLFAFHSVVRFKYHNLNPSESWEWSKIFSTHATQWIFF